MPQRFDQVLTGIIAAKPHLPGFGHPIWPQKRPQKRQMRLDGLAGTEEGKRRHIWPVWHPSLPFRRNVRFRNSLRKDKDPPLVKSRFNYR
jgi:hypothetical protein